MVDKAQGQASQDKTSAGLGLARKLVLMQEAKVVAHTKEQVERCPNKLVRHECCDCEHQSRIVLRHTLPCIQIASCKERELVGDQQRGFPLAVHTVEEVRHQISEIIVQIKTKVDKNNCRTQDGVKHTHSPTPAIPLCGPDGKDAGVSHLLRDLQIAPPAAMLAHFL